MELDETLMWHRWCVAVGQKKACGGKKKHKDQSAANRVAQMANRRWHRGDMTPHPCAWCGAWHATRMLPAEVRADLETRAAELDSQLRHMEHTAARYAWTTGT